MYALQKKSLRIKNHDGTVAEVPALLTHDEERLEAVEAAVTAEAATRAAADVTLNGGYATLSTQLEAEKKKVKILQRTVENLDAASKGKIAQDIVDSDVAHTKSLPNLELAGLNTTVLPNGLLQSIGGRTVVWNQLCTDLVSAANSTGITFSKLPDGGYVFNGTASSDADALYNFTSKSFTQGHVIYFYGCPSGGSASTYHLLDAYVGTTVMESGNGCLYKVVNTNSLIRFRIMRGTTVSNLVVKPQSVDLTQFCGITETSQTSIDALEAYFDTSKALPYNAGTLMSLPTKSVDITKRNLYAPESVRLIDDMYGHEFAGGVTYSLANKSGNSAYGLGYYTIKNDGTGKSSKLYVTQGVKRTVTVPSGYKLIAGCGTSVKQYQECFMVSVSSTALDFEPYCRLTLVIPQSVKALPGYGWSAGSVCNEVDWENKQYVQRVKRLLSVSASVRSTVNGNPVFVIRRVVGKKEGGSCVCSKYTTVDDYIFRAGTDKCINTNWWLNSGEIYIRDYSYEDVDTFNNANADMVIYYELAEPIVTDISSMIDDNLLTNLETGGTVTFVADGVDPSGTVVLTSDEQSIPVPSTIAYQTKIAS